MANNIKIKFLNDTYEGDNAIRFIDGKSDWIDLRCAEDIEIKAGEHKLLPLGVAMQLPTGFEAWVVPRSSTFKNFGVLQTNHIGIIDSSYCGDNDWWFMSVLAMRDTIIHKGDRVCQFRLMTNQDVIEFKTVESLDNPDRGGHGSSGKN